MGHWTLYNTQTKKKEDNDIHKENFALKKKKNFKRASTRAPALGARAPDLLFG